MENELISKGIPVLMLLVLGIIEAMGGLYFDDRRSKNDWTIELISLFTLDVYKRQAVHFEYYFRHVPHIIRRNRNSIAVLSGNETPEQLRRLGDDVFSYFGLGCRNVSLILVPEGYDITLVLDAFEPFKELMYHNKYKNNYDYNQALMLLNKETFLQSEFLILKQSDQVISRIASLHYQYYKNQDDLITWLRSKAVSYTHLWLRTIS